MTSLVRDSNPIYQSTVCKVRCIFSVYIYIYIYYGTYCTLQQTLAGISFKSTGIFFEPAHYTLFYNTLSSVSVSFVFTVF